MPAYPFRPSTSKPTAAGVLMILAGLMSAGFWAVVVFSTGSLVAQSVTGSTLAQVQGVLAVCGGIEILFSVLMIVGGAFATQRKMWGIALVGSILGLFTIGFLFLSSLFALIAIILIATSHNEFR